MPIGERRMFVVFVRDITTRKRHERLKDEFVATVSHELRTPMTSIAGSLGLLAGGAAGPLPDPAKRLLTIAHSNSQRLVRLINDILDIEKIESGKVVFAMEPVELQGAGRAGDRGEQGLCRELRRHGAARSGLRRGGGARRSRPHDPGGHQPSVQRGEILAARRGGRGRRSRTRAPRRGSPCATTARACRRTIASRIFEKFVQVDATDARQKGGTGLGLSIVKQIMLRLGGEVGLEPRAGRRQHLPRRTAVLGSHRASGNRAARPRRQRAHPALRGRSGRRGGAGGPAARRRVSHRRRLHRRGGGEGRGDALLRRHPGRPATAGQRRHQPDQESAGAAALSQHADRRGFRRSQARPRRPALLDAQRARLAGEAGGHRAAAACARTGRSCATTTCGRASCISTTTATCCALVAQALGSTAEVVSVESIDEARHVLDTHHFDLAVLDVGLAEGFGLDLLPDLCGADGRPIPVVVFSAQDSPEVAARVLAVLSKSRASIDSLVTTLRRLVAGQECASARPDDKGGRMSAVRVLHVDDEPDIREVVELSLSLDPDLTVRSLRLRRRCARGRGDLVARPDPARRHDADDGRADHAHASAAEPEDRRHPGGVHDGAGAAARARAFRLARRRGRDRQAVRSDDAGRLGAQLRRRACRGDCRAARKLPRADAGERQGAGAALRRAGAIRRGQSAALDRIGSIAHSIAGGGAIFGFVA